MRSVRCFDWFILLWCHWTNLGLLPKWQLWATFFISIIKIISIIGLIFIMIQGKMLLLNLWLQKKMANIKFMFRSDQNKALLILYLSSASLIIVFSSVRRAVHSSLALANRYINNCFSCSGHICIWRISRWNSNMGDLDLFLQIVQVRGHACLISNQYIKTALRNRSSYSVPVCTTGVSGEYRGQVEI